jgi:tyrosyl-tRNA synthetase
LIAAHKQDAAKRLLQKTLAKEVTIFVHGEEEYKKAIDTTDKLFTNQQAPAESLSAEDLEGIEGIVKCSYAADKINTGIDLVSFLTETAIFPSKGEARKMIQNGGISINRVKAADPAMPVDKAQLLHDKFILVQKGKKNYYLVTLSE